MANSTIKKHFLENESPENKIRYLIFQLMTHFEEMHELLSQLIEFTLSEENVKDELEKHFIEMEKLHYSLGKELASIKEKNLFEQSPLNEAVRRTYNHLKTLNHIDLDKKEWVRMAGQALLDKTYYRQLKLFIFN